MIIYNFAYFFNAVFYCMHLQHFRVEQKRTVLSARLKAFLWETFSLRKPDLECYEAEKLYAEVRLRAMKMGKESVVVERDFRSVTRFGSISFTVLYIFIITAFIRNPPLLLVAYLMGAPMILLYFLICAVVFQEQRYKAFFREFRKEDDAWIRKWTKITLAYELTCCVGPFILGILFLIFFNGRQLY